jgi:hypothetical protein
MINSGMRRENRIFGAMPGFNCQSGGKEVHASDVAKEAELVECARERDCRRAVQLLRQIRLRVGRGSTRQTDFRKHRHTLVGPRVPPRHAF